MHTIGALRVDLSAAQQGYLSRVALLHYGSLDLAHADMLRKFIQIAPWAARPALEWQAPPPRNTANSVVAFLELDSDLRALLQATIAEINALGYNEVTSPIFVHTAFVWWTTFVYPQHPYN